MCTDQNVVLKEFNFSKIWNYVDSDLLFAIIGNVKGSLDGIDARYECLYMDGYWIENEDTSEKEMVEETCIFAVCVEKSVYTLKRKRERENRFVKNILELTSKYNQEAVLIRDSRGIKIYSSNGDVLEDIGTIRPGELGDVYRRMRNKKARFVFSKERNPTISSKWMAIEENKGVDYYARKFEKTIFPKVWWYLNSKSRFAIITAHSENIDDDSNEQRNKMMAKEVKNLGHSCLFLNGYWIQERGLLYEQRFPETCLFVMGKIPDRDFDYKTDIARRLRNLADEYEREIVSFDLANGDKNEKFVHKIKELGDECSQENITAKPKTFADEIGKLAREYDQNAFLISDNGGFKIYSTGGKILHDNEYKFEPGMAGKFYRKMRNKKMRFVFEGEREIVYSCI